jgi:hypothetical protein
MAVVTGFYKSTMCDDVRHVAKLGMLEFAVARDGTPTNRARFITTSILTILLGSAALCVANS